MPTPRLSSTRPVTFAIVLGLILSASAGGSAGARAIAQPAATPLLQTGDGSDVPVVHDAFVADLGPIGVMASEGDLVVAGAGLYAVRLDASVSPPTLEARSERLSGVVTDIVLGERYAYAALSDGGLAVLDVHAPDHLRTLASLGLPGSGGKLLLVENRLYLAAGDEGLYIVDVADPLLPRRLGSLSEAQIEALDGAHALAWHAGDLVVVGDVALARVDVRDTSAPRILATHGFEGSDAGVEPGRLTTRAVAVVGDHAYLPAWPPLAFDLADPTRIVFSGTPVSEQPSRPCYWDSYTAEAFGTFDGFLVLAGNGRVFVFDVADPAKPAARNQLSGLAWTESLALVDGRLWVAAERGIAFVEGSLASRGIVEVGCAYLGEADIYEDIQLEVRDGLGVVSGMQALAVLDLAEASMPRILGSAYLDSEQGSESAPDMAWMGDRVVFGLESWDEGPTLEIWDIEQPEQPQHVVTHVLEGADVDDSPWIAGLEAADETLLVLHSQRNFEEPDASAAQLEVLDIADPTAIGSLARLTLDDRGRVAAGMHWGAPGVLWVLLVPDPRAQESEEGGLVAGLVALDLSEPTSPRVLGSVPLRDGEGTPLELDPWDPTFLVGAERGYVSTVDGLAAIDTTDPTAPAVLARIDLPCTLVANGMVEDHVLCTGDVGIQRYDLTNPAAPRLVNDAGPICHDYCGRIFLAGERLFIFDSYALSVLDVAGRDNLRIAGWDVTLGAHRMVGLGAAWGLVRQGGRCGLLSASAAVTPLPTWDCRWRNVAAVPGTALGIAYDPDYDVEERNALVVTDFTGPEAQDVGKLDLWSEGRGQVSFVTAREDLALAIGGPNNDLYFVDLSDPGAPALVAELDLGLRPPLNERIALSSGGSRMSQNRSAAIGDRAAFVLVEQRVPGDDDAELFVVAIDLTNRTRPRIAGRIAIGSCSAACFTYDVAMVDHGGYLLARAHEGPVQLINVRDVDAPAIVGQLHVPDLALNHVATAGPWAWVTQAGQNTIHQFLLTDPAAPREISRRIVPGRVSDLAAAGDQVFVMDTLAGPLRLHIGSGLQGGRAFLPIAGF